MEYRQFYRLISQTQFEHPLHVARRHETPSGVFCIWATKEANHFAILKP